MLNNRELAQIWHSNIMEFYAVIKNYVEYYLM